jgi:hypothetical protein
MPTDPPGRDGIPLRTGCTWRPLRRDAATCSWSNTFASLPTGRGNAADCATAVSEGGGRTLWRCMQLTVPTYTRTGRCSRWIRAPEQYCWVQLSHLAVCKALGTAVAAAQCQRAYVVITTLCKQAKHQHIRHTRRQMLRAWSNPCLRPNGSS